MRLALREEMAKVAEERPAAPGDSYLSVVEAARLISVHPATVRAWIRCGRLQAYRAGRHYRVRCSELQAYVASQPENVIDLDARAAELAAA